MFQITKERTPVLFQQPQAVQTLAQQSNSHYTSQKSVQVRQQWRKFLKQIQEGDLNCVNAKGESVQNENPRKATFEAIGHELGISRSSGYTYINEYITAQTYPQVIRDAAAEAGLNLALPHVQAAYGEMVAQGFLFQTANGTMLDPNNVDRDSLRSILEEMDRYEAEARFNVFRRFRAAAQRGPSTHHRLLDGAFQREHGRPLRQTIGGRCRIQAGASCQGRPGF